MHSHLNPNGVLVDILARSIHKDENLLVAQKAERAITIGLPLADLEVILYVRRWVATADEQNVKSDAIEQLREVLKIHAGRSHKDRRGKIKATPVLEESLLDKLLSDD